MEPQKKDVKQETKEWVQALCVAVAVALIIRLFIFEFVVVEQTSMYPTLCEGEKLGLFKLAYIIDEPQYGDIVVFESDAEGGKDLVKRVIAVGGQTVSARDNIVYIDGEALSERYIAADEFTFDFEELTVPEGYIYVMGDNRDGSKDSRMFGAVSTDDVRGRIIFRLSPLTSFKRF